MEPLHRDSDLIVQASWFASLCLNAPSEESLGEMHGSLLR
jgi:hypothetical protein